jgi:hypothetical protein
LVEADGVVVRCVSRSDAAAADALPGLGICLVGFRRGEPALQRSLGPAALPPGAAATAARSAAEPGVAVVWGWRTPPAQPARLIGIWDSGMRLLTREPRPAGTRVYVAGRLPLYRSTQDVRVVAQVRGVQPAMDEIPDGWAIELAYESVNVDAQDLARHLAARLAPTPRQDAPGPRPGQDLAAAAAARPEVRHQPAGGDQARAEPETRPPAPAAAAQAPKQPAAVRTPAARPDDGLRGLDASIQEALEDFLREPSQDPPEPPAWQPSRLQRPTSPRPPYSPYSPYGRPDPAGPGRPPPG